MTAFSEAFEKFKQENPDCFREETLTAGPYLEHRLHRAFAEAWIAAAAEADRLIVEKFKGFLPSGSASNGAER